MAIKTTLIKSRRVHRPVLSLSVAICATLLCNGSANAQSTSTATPNLLEFLGILPAVTYDPYQSQIPRRRPGHPPEPLPMFVEQNPDAVNPAPVDQAGEFLPVPDRWRIMESLGFKHSLLDPYNQNVLKGDKPIRGNDHFLSLLAISDTIIEPRSIPTPVGPQGTGGSGDLDVLGRTNQLILAQTFIFGADYYIGDTTFKPPDLEFKTLLAFNYNRVQTQEPRALQVNPDLGKIRDDGFIGVQELFVDKHLRNVSSRYDFDSIRVGIQPFNSDFRGFLFQDSQLGIRLFGNRDNNFWQYNFAWFRRLDKDINSGLNDVTKSPRKDDVFIANLYRQDFPFVGFTSQITAAYNRNREDSAFYDSNGFIQRPSSLGLEIPRTYDVGYFGYNADGHIGRINLTASAYYAFGKQTPGVFVRKGTDIRAGFAAAEASIDYSWIRLRASLAYASGDDDPYDDRSTGYDAIFENPIFAGADTSYWIRQNVPLIGGGGVALAQRNGLLNNLRSSKENGQSNFDNPGLRLIGMGADFDLTPASRVAANLNALWFDNTAVLETARNQGDIGRHIGTDASVSWIYRPHFTQNIIVRLSAAALLPGSGFKDLYGDQHSTYYSVLGNIVLTY
ncbi:MAG TPA: hypothetical protein VFN25_13080 [Dokdonella sp.]|uniref:hypothetical protein n=1 Tax=Dokdonella sp. TaxID=2291710 RepID=UPI002D7E8546|nr:hypothetical protein [Dokdonella sp.]HET9033821.1 hypothetical protein [Dokdonella sp.]